VTKTSTKYVSDSFLADRYSVSRNTVWRWAQQGTLPKPVKLSHGCTRWNLAEIEAHEQAIRSSADNVGVL
jgi:prophage regulatory protein